MSDGRAARVLIGPLSKPVLPRHVKLRRDAARDRWTILAPERVFAPDAIALAVLQLCDGARTTDDIAEQLAHSYTAPKTQILADVVAMLQDLADKGVVQA
ncbi:MAG TPA: pyrroloquinoline quinone biosynthesis peptide chaperone PqqD [Hyphomicrobiaceae bacterium]|jgi:pyrroloquinoline quinone biosynthesis protein D|nr:pyrroloquinoline quinone biosynthesis peptide chaperone PqqD [Hyphomicrobiaceae bacterium]